MDRLRVTATLGLCAVVAACAPESSKKGSTIESIASGGAPPSGGASGESSGGVGPFREVDATIFEPGEGGISTGRLRQTDKVDLLVVVDDSISMSDKHAILKAAVPDLVKRLVNPVCIATTGATSQPASPADACPSGMDREFKPVDDMHLGVITSSLGGYEGVSSGCAGDIGADGNDGAHFLGLLQRGRAVPTYANSGFFSWDRLQRGTPPGESDVNRMVTSFGDLVDAVGEKGCGLEASLEAWYRSLVDPEPYERVQRVYPDGGVAHTDILGTDTTVLTQRQQFLRPDSLVIVVVLTDEDDCSIMPELIPIYGESGLSHPRGSTPCATNPDDPCCYPCTDVAPSGCPADPLCKTTPYLTHEEDRPNLACYRPKERFGIEHRYPLKRYVDGLTSKRVQKRDGTLVDNPLFAAGQRTKDEVYLIGITGVPWQDLATDATLKSATQLRLKSATELGTGGWDVILGSGRTPPKDPLMIDSIAARAGTNPITGDALAVSTAGYLANPINGHERDILGLDEPQFSCIFPLTATRECLSDSASSCDCKKPTDGEHNPLCQDETGAYTNTQRFAKAYPPPRILTLMKSLGESAVVASICPKNVTDPKREDYGYRPVIGATIRDVAPSLIR